MLKSKTILVILLAGLSLALLAVACTTSSPRDNSPEQASVPAAVEAAVPQPQAQQPVSPSMEKTSLSSVAEKGSMSGVAEQGSLAAVSVSASQDEPARAVLVTGQEEASAAPDLATLSVGVEASGPTVREARNTAATAIQDMMDALEQRDIAGEDIQTSRLNIYPKYGSRTVTRCPESEQGMMGGGSVPRQEIAIELSQSKTEECITVRESVITGYEVNHQVTVKLRDLEDVGEVIDEVTDAGGDLARFESIRFSLDNPKPLQDEALANAIAAAQAKAEHIADESGVTLGDIIRISEGSAPPGSPYPSFARAVALESDAAMAVTTTVSGGAVTVHATVSAVYGVE